MRSLQDLDVSGRRVLVRADLNVPLARDPETSAWKVAEDTRIRAALETIEQLRGRGARVVLVSHLGRPRNRDPDLSMRPVADRVRELTGARLVLGPAVVGDDVEMLVQRLAPGEILMLQNVRYEPGETRNDPELARRLARLADLYVNDAFASAHRAHASTEGVAHLLPSAAGMLMERELRALEVVRDRPQRPLLALLGGAKVTDKIALVERFLDSADRVLIGGAMSFPFLAAQGHGVGASACLDADVDSAREILAHGAEAGRRLELPDDLVIAERLSAEADWRVVDAPEVPQGSMGLDIGPRTAARYASAIAGARTAFWNGPMGAFECAAFAHGTAAVARALADSDAITVAGGGETVQALRDLGLESSLTHVSTGGGATLEFLQGLPLPGVAALESAPAPGQGRPAAPSSAPRGKVPAGGSRA
jgi:phosphoglycerate kinase